jgi:hypothetical protein
VGGNRAEPNTPIVPRVTAEKIQGPTVARNGYELAELSTGHQIVLSPVKGKLMFKAEATLTDVNFERLQREVSQLHPADRAKAVSNRMSEILAQLAKVQGVVVTRKDEIAYFSLMLPFTNDLFAEVKDLDLGDGNRIALNPVVHDPNVLKEIRALKPNAEELPPRSGSLDASKGFSGLERMGAIEFVRLAEADIGNGAKVDGSTVTVGITDTGITYNHPTFRSAKGENRIVYMKDFTDEGITYFVPGAKFEAVAGESAEELVINAEVVVTPRLPARPVGDRLTPINGLKIKVSTELRERLLAAGVNARLAFLNEDSVQSPADAVDINNNGKLDDKLYMILVSGTTPEEDVVFFDPTGTGDFRRAQAMGDWNRTHQTVNVFAEKIGFTIEKTELAAGADGSSTVEARRSLLSALIRETTVRMSLESRRVGRRSPTTMI